MKKLVNVGGDVVVKLNQYLNTVSMDELTNVRGDLIVQGVGRSPIATFSMPNLVSVTGTIDVKTTKGTCGGSGGAATAAEMLCVNLATSTWHQRCFDEGCRGFRSGERPLPEAAAGEIYDVLLDEATRDAEAEDRAKRRRTAPTYSVQCVIRGRLRRLGTEGGLGRGPGAAPRRDTSPEEAVELREEDRQHDEAQQVRLGAGAELARRADVADGPLVAEEDGVDAEARARRGDLRDDDERPRAEAAAAEPDAEHRRDHVEDGVDDGVAHVLARRVGREGDLDDVLPELPEHEEEADLPGLDGPRRVRDRAEREAPDRVREVPLVEDVLVHVDRALLVDDGGEGAAARAAPAVPHADALRKPVLCWTTSGGVLLD